MAEPTKPKTLSELKKQLSTQSIQTTLSKPKTLSELKVQMPGDLTQPSKSKPKTLSDLKKQTFKDVKEEKVGAIENLYRIGAGAIRDVAQVTRDNLQESLALQGTYDPIKAVYSKLIDVTPDLPEIEEPTTSLEIKGVDVPVGSFARDLAGIAIPFWGPFKSGWSCQRRCIFITKRN